MSIEIVPLRVWQENTLQNHIPANDNALRQEVMVRPCLGVANDEAGGDQDGDVWIVGDTPTGAFASFDENDVAMLRQGNWYAWKPFEGMRLVVAGVRKVFDSGAWVDDPSIGGGGGSPAPVVTVTDTSRTIDPDTDAGAYLRFTNGSAKTVTFDSADGFTVDQEFHITNRASSGNLTLTEAGTMTLNPPKGGTLVLEPGDTVTVKMVDTDEADVMGSTEASS